MKRFIFSLILVVALAFPMVRTANAGWGEMGGQCAWHTGWVYVGWDGSQHVWRQWWAYYCW